MVNHHLLAVNQKVEVIGHRAARPVLWTNLFESGKTGRVDFCQHRLLLLGNIIKVEGIAHLFYSLGGMAAQKEWVVGDIKEIPTIVIDDIDALVGSLGDGFYGIKGTLGKDVVFVGNTGDAVAVDEKVSYLCHYQYC